MIMSREIVLKTGIIAIEAEYKEQIIEEKIYTKIFLFWRNQFIGRGFNFSLE